jgi:hypothetical protein
MQLWFSATPLALRVYVMALGALGSSTGAHACMINMLALLFHSRSTIPTAEVVHCHTPCSPQCSICFAAYGLVVWTAMGSTLQRSALGEPCCVLRGQASWVHALGAVLFACQVSDGAVLYMHTSFTCRSTFFITRHPCLAVPVLPPAAVSILRGSTGTDITTGNSRPGYACALFFSFSSWRGHARVTYWPPPVQAARICT